MIGWMVLLPLTGAVLTLGGSRAASRPIALAVAGAITATALLGARGVWRDGPQRLAAGGWDPPLGIALHLDGLAALMLVMAAVVSLTVAIYSLGYYPGATAARSVWESERVFWPLLFLLWGAMNALFLSGDAFNLYVALEVSTLAAVGLVVLAGEAAAFAAAMRYLLAAFLGSMTYMLGVGLLYSAFGTLDLGLLAERMSATPAAWAALALMTVGLCLKTALFPFHFWLPGAHARAPAPVSALLSTLVVTASFYLVLRLWVFVFAPILNVPAGQLLGALGAAAILWGSALAIRQQRLKQMVAYSTVAQIGYLFLMVPLLLGIGDPRVSPSAGLAAWNGGLYHALSHAFAKAAMFLAVGAIARSLGHDRIVGISGIASRMPISTYAFGIAGMTLIGLPPSGGFVSKWLLLSAAIGGRQWWWAVVILAGGILTAGYVFLVLGQELSEAKSDREVEFAPVPPVMEYAAMGLALAALLLGIRTAEVIQLLGAGAPALLLPGTGP
jgi:multicomponent Na+:H+ antiporter subunit D